MMKALVGAILMIVTSAGEMPNGEPTGLWLEEFSVPYEMFVNAGYSVTVASPLGGKAPVDPRSLEPGAKPDSADRFLTLLKNTVPLEEVDLYAYDAFFFPGGHGTMFDFPVNEHVAEAVRHGLAEGKPVGLVCHGPAALVGATDNGRPVVEGMSVTGFTDAEEAAVGLTDAVPFLLETRLRELGGDFSGGANFEPHVVIDNNLITGQNPASSGKAASALLHQLDVMRE